MRRTIIALLLIAAFVFNGALIAECKKPNKKSLTSKLASVARNLTHVKAQLKQVKQQKKTAENQLYYTEQRLEDVQSKVSANKLHLYQAQSRLKLLQERLMVTRKQLDRRTGLLSRRLADIYEGEDLTYLNVILGSGDVWTLLTRSYYIHKVVSSDVSLMEDIRKDEAQIKQDQREQSQKVSEIAGLQANLVSQRDEQKQLADSRQQQLNEIENNLSEYEQQYNELMAESNAIQQAIQRLQNTPAGKKRYARKYTGGFNLPVSGRISSGFGYRYHPILHINKLHTGVDIAAPIGTPIHAAGDGEVILAGWMKAYGHAVVIDHGGGVSTLYGHCSVLLVHVGQQIHKGDVIAKVGSSGWSTGPHCHFEKRVNGSPVSPL